MKKRIMPANRLTKFAERVETIMHENELYQQEFAWAIGVSGNTVSEWRHSGILPNGETLMVIGETFGVSVDWLVGRTDIREVNR